MSSVAYISHSVTTYQFVNLGYRFFVIDGDHDKSTSVSVYPQPLHLIEKYMKSGLYLIGEFT